MVWYVPGALSLDRWKVQASKTYPCVVGLQISIPILKYLQIPSNTHNHPHTQSHTHKCIYIYIYICWLLKALASKRIAKTLTVLLAPTSAALSTNPSCAVLLICHCCCLIYAVAAWRNPTLKWLNSISSIILLDSRNIWELILISVFMGNPGILPSLRTAAAISQLWQPPKRFMQKPGSSVMPTWRRNVQTRAAWGFQSLVGAFSPILFLICLGDGRSTICSPTNLWFCCGSLWVDFLPAALMSFIQAGPRIPATSK